ncbi:MAG: ABC transporter substrate-binding protein, partial [Bacteroidales bacterium]
VFSLKRLLDPVTASPGEWVLSKVRRTNGLPDIWATDDSTVVIRLTQPFPPFLSILSMPYCSVIPKEAVDYYGKEFRMHPVGTGPFQMQNWVENIKLVLRKNPHYFETSGDTSLPLLEGVAISFLIDKMTAFMEFAKGNFDFMSGIDPSYKDELLNKSGELKSKYEDRFTLLSQPFLNTEYLAMLVDTTLPAVKNSPLAIKKVRQAINYGFDRQKMLRYLRNNIGVAGTKGIIPNGMPASDPKAGYGYSFQPEKAKQLLREAGYTTAHPIPPITLVTTPDYLDIIKFVQSQLQEIGFALTIEVSPPGSVREMKAQGKIPFFRASWIADYPDEENYLSLFHSTNFAPQGPNYTHFSMPAYDSLYQVAMLETDPIHRTRYYRQLDSLMMEEAPVAILYYDESVRIVQKDVHGITTNPMNMLNLKRVTKGSK